MLPRDLVGNGSRTSESAGPVVVGVDGRFAAIRAARWAAAVAARLDAPLRIVHAMPRWPIMPTRLYAKRSATLSGTPAPPHSASTSTWKTSCPSRSSIDNGRGTSGDITGNGLVRLRERARDAGGSFAIEPAPSGGRNRAAVVSAVAWTDLRLRSSGPTALVA